MIASARKLHPDCDCDVLDAGSLDELDTDFDVVFSNACLQWVPNHGLSKEKCVLSCVSMACR